MTKEERTKQLAELHQQYLDNLATWEGNEFLELRETYDIKKKHYLELIEDARKKSRKTIITKGEIESIYPFEVEQKGYKTNGKVIPEIVFSNDCYIHHYDEQEKLILKERVSEFLKKPYYFSLYYYSNNRLEYIYGSVDEIYRYQDFMISDDGRFIKGMYYAEKGKGYEIYQYDDRGKIIRRKEFQLDFSRNPQWQSSTEQEYLYDEKGKLQQIFHHYENGGKRIVYSTLKINFKKIEERILCEIESLISDFIAKNGNEPITRLGLDCNSPDFLFLCFDTHNSEDTLYSLADWKYVEEGEIALIDFPIDDEQVEKLILTIAKVLVALVASEEFNGLFTKSDFKIVFLDHQSVVKDSYPRVAKLLRNSIFY